MEVIMMEYEAIITSIGTLGFPIVMCLLLGWYVYAKDKTHSEDINKLSEAVNAQNTNIQKLVDRFDILLDKIMKKE